MLEMQINHHPVTGDTFPDHPLEYWWRVESTYCWLADGSCAPTIHFERYAILRRTPKGVWLYPFYLRRPKRKYEFNFIEKTKRIVFLDAEKKFAYPTKKQAWESFIIRQNHRVQHAKNSLEAAETIRLTAITLDKEKPYG